MNFALRNSLINSLGDNPYISNKLASHPRVGSNPHSTVYMPAAKRYIDKTSLIPGVLERTQ